MDRVEEIEAAIDSLAPDEFRRVVEWLRERDDAVWEAQMDQDSASGKLDFLFEEADEAENHCDFVRGARMTFG